MLTKRTGTMFGDCAVLSLLLFPALLLHPHPPVNNRIALPGDCDGQVCVWGAAGLAGLLSVQLALRQDMREAAGLWQAPLRPGGV